MASAGWHRSGYQGSLHPLGVNRVRDAPQVMFAQIGQFGGAPDQATGRGGDNNLIGGGQSCRRAARFGVLPTASFD
jgi:hypothetical protein